MVNSECFCCICILRGLGEITEESSATHMREYDTDHLADIHRAASLGGDVTWEVMLCLLVRSLSCFAGASEEAFKERIPRP